MHSFATFLYKFLTGFFTFEFSIFSLLNIFNYGANLPGKPADFEPTVRFAVCSDVHLNGEEGQAEAEKFRKMFDEVYDYSASQSYSKLDAVLVAGDFTGRGEDAQYEAFNSIVSEKIKSETKLLTCLGNHEFIAYRDEDPTVGYEKYKQFINENVDTHEIIGGYHFIGVSYSDDARTFTSKKEWLRTELNKAVDDTGDKPIFVFQHPQPFNTVYGSINWGDLTMKAVLSCYPQVVDFSGHSHYASSDPRSIWQGSFTAVGCGAVTSLMGNLNYISGDEDAPGESGSCWVCEADKEGNVRLQLLDLVSGKFFEKNEYYLTNLGKVCKRTYTWGNMKHFDTKPRFDKNAVITLEKDAEGNAIISFPDAASYWETESYLITITKGCKTVYNETVISNYVRTEKNGMSINIGKFEAGEYSIRVTPVSPYAKTGEAIGLVTTL